MNYDVIIIGGGVTGAAIARELTRCGHEVAVLHRGQTPGDVRQVG